VEADGMNRILLLSLMLAALAAGETLAPRVAAQDSEGRSAPITGGKNGPKTPKGGNTPRPAPRCEPGEIIVRCGTPGCAVSLGENLVGMTNAAGELRFPARSGTHAVAAGKPYHEDARAQVSLACGGKEAVELRPRAKTVALRIRTNLPECDIYVNGSSSPVGRSDARGVFDYRVVPSQLLVEARKKGYLSQMQRVGVAPDGSVREIAFALEPIKASLTISAGVAGARVSVDGGAQTQPATDRVSLAPGRHRVTVEALGHAPATFEVDPAPDERIAKSVTLARLPAAELVRRAESLYNQRAYQDVLTLCNYVFEADGNNPSAHRLAGLAFLAGQDYGRAGAHLEKALSANEIVRLQVRRHPGEGFDLNKGHNDCDAVVTLNKHEVEFQGLRDPAANYRVPYAQIEVVGVQLKKNAALYLGTKVTVARGKKKEYNFYSFDKELSQSGRPFLNMLQLLLKPH
jgi:hypothetical protein